MSYGSNGPLLASVCVHKQTIYFLSTMHVAEPPTATTCSVKKHTAAGTLEDVRHTASGILEDERHTASGTPRG